MVDAIRNRDWSQIPPKALVITIDDGHKTNYALLEIFKTYNIKPTIYICSHIVNTHRHFWWKTGYHNFLTLKQLPTDSMLKLLRKEVNYWPQREYSDRQALNKAELQDMSRHVDFQSHTQFHLILPNCNNQVSSDEIVHSKKALEKLLNKPIKHFSYPDGNYGEREVEYLKKYGYISARTSDWGWNDKHTDPYKLKIININEYVSIHKLCAQLSGCYRFLEVLLSHKM